MNEQWEATDGLDIEKAHDLQNMWQGGTAHPHNRMNQKVPSPLGLPAARLGECLTWS
jgi:hypothetical protein